MNADPATALSSILFALADPTRRGIIEHLRGGDAAVIDVASPFAMSQPAVSKHLVVLERAGLISRHRVARKNMCRLEPGALKRVSDWVGTYRDFWEGSLSRLDAYLASDEIPEAR
jgi:DNA-binding transcriptional ArsR family regulator